MKELLEIIETNQELIVNQLKEIYFEFITEDEYHNQDDVIYDSPRCYEVAKYGYHIEYVILNVKKGGKFTIATIGEDYGETRTVDISFFGLDEIVQIAGNLN